MPRHAFPLLVLLVLPLVLLAPEPAARAEDDASDLPTPPSSWLVLAPVDRRARRPFNPDAVFHRYLLDRRSVTPGEDTVVKGTAGEATWTRVEPDAKGRVGGRIAWAYGEMQSDRNRIVMASLRSGATLFVNGTPHVGAIYGDAFAVPVALRKGKNEIYVRGVRGAFALTFAEPPAPVFLATFRQTKPDLVAGEPVDMPVGVVLVNATNAPLDAASVALRGADWLAPMEAVSRPVAPLGLVQMPIRVRSKPDAVVPAAVDKVVLDVIVRAGPEAPGRLEQIEVPVRSRDDATLRTFVSKIDDSVQRYGMRRPLPATSDSDGTAPMGLVLSLHGAGVNPRGQARAYSRKEDFWLFAPTNRDRFGFDWQDWGRLDAYEVLEEGLKFSGVPRDRVYLTGHSMGGHGTWHLGANDPDGFAAIAPSAGWISFDTYGGPRPKDKHVETWHAADAASLTRRLIDNLVQLPTYVLHGTKDDNVPPGQAREMIHLLTEAGAMPSAHFERGAKHWWDGYPEPGAACVDWPAFYQLFRKVSIPKNPRRIRFTTVHPSVDSRHHWVEVHRVVEYGKPAKVTARYRPKKHTFELTTENVLTLKLTHPAKGATIVVGGTEVRVDRPDGGAVKTSDEPMWLTCHPRPARERAPQADGSSFRKTPQVGGPFKQAWRNRFVMVHGTAGDDAMDRALLEQARFDAQRWMYRANGQTMLVSDRQYAGLRRDHGFATRNAVLYGNPHTNTAFATWRPILPTVAPGRAVLGSRADGPAARPERLVPAVGSDIGSCTVSPSEDGRRQCAVIGSSGIPATRAGFSLMLFVSGAGWPDYTLWSSAFLLRGDEAVIDTGFYDARWYLRGAPLKRLRMLQPPRDDR